MSFDEIRDMAKVEIERAQQRVELSKELTQLKKRYGNVFDDIVLVRSPQSVNTGKKVHGRTGMTAAVRDWLRNHPEGGSVRAIWTDIAGLVGKRPEDDCTRASAALWNLEQTGQIDVIRRRGFVNQYRLKNDADCAGGDQA